MLDRHFTDLDENHYKDVIKALEHRCTKGIMYKHDYIEKPKKISVAMIYFYC